MITEIVEKVMRNGIISFAEKAGVRIGHSQIMIFCKEDTAIPCYKSLIYEQPSREVSFNEILGVKVDLLNREGIAAPFIQNAILRFSKEFNIAPNHIHIVIFVNEINKSVNLHLYNGATSIKPISLDEVLNQPK